MADLFGGLKAAEELVERTKLCTFAVSFGGAKTLIELPAAMTHRPIAGTEDATVPGGLVRLAVGLEEPEEIIADLEQALDVSSAPRRSA